jgi:arylsulfatase A-like enzyme
VPLHPGQDFQGQSANGKYGDWVEEVDWSVGRVLATLKELKLDTRTLVLFTSDNGPWLTQGKNGGVAGPLRGGKGSTWEGGMREPTIAWWPGHVPAGASCDTVAGTIDLLPTFVSLAGGTVPTDRKIDGADISKLLLGQTKEPAREAHYYFQGTRLQAVRSGPWKLALVPQATGMGVQQGDALEKGLRLYNLDADIGEKTSVAEQNLDVVAKLKALAEKMAAELGDGSAKGSGVRPPGVVENPEFLYPVQSAAAKPDAKKKAK